MILDALTLTSEVFERRTGWAVKPEGLCKGDICVPLPDGGDGPTLDASMLSRRLNMPLIQDEQHGLWCLGPEALGKTLMTAEMPDVVLPDLEGNPFRLRSLLGRKVLLVAWASW